MAGRMIRRLVVLLVVFLVVFVWAGVVDKDETDEDPKPGQGIHQQVDSSLTKIIEEAGKKQEELNNSLLKFNRVRRQQDNKIDAVSPLILQKVYQDSDRVEEVILKMPENFIGLTTEQLSTLLNDWHLKEYNPGKALVLVKKINNDKSIEQDHLQLGIKDDKVSIFYNDSGKKYLKQQTEIKVSDLPEKEQQLLKRGIGVSSDEELLTILESLISINQD